MNDSHPSPLPRPLRTAAYAVAALLIVLTAACSGEKEHTAPAISAKDSVPFMHAEGVSSLISDSGVIRYKIVAEEWNIHETTNPKKWVFIKGLFLEKFDTTFHAEWFLQSDTAYCYNQQLWELRGRVVMRNVRGDVFRTEELFWDMSAHEVYSTKFMRIITPDRELAGYRFRSNEQMTKYTIYDTEGAFPVNDAGGTPDSTARTAPSKPL